MPVLSHNYSNGAGSGSGSDYSVEKENRVHPRYGHHHDQVDHYHRSSPFRSSPHHSFFPGFADEFFNHTPFSRSFDEMMPVLRNLDRSAAEYTIHHSSPGYEINESADEYQICLDVPGVHLQDLDLQLENYGHILHVVGKREIHRDGKPFITKFEKRFRIGHNIDHDRITARLSEGVLVVTAPKLRDLKKKPKHISIHEGENP